MRWLWANPGYKLLALAVALLLWGLSHSDSDVEKPIDVPLEIRGAPEDLVVTATSVEEVNLRIMGTRAALRNLSTTDLVYPLDLAGAKPGQMTVDVDTSRLDLPRGARVVSRSPSRVDVTLSQRHTRSVEIRVDVDGDPAPGHRIVGVEVVPPRVKITGARAEVLRLNALETEEVDVTGAAEDVEKEVRLLLGGDNVWLQEPVRVRVRVRIAPDAGAQENA